MNVSRKACLQVLPSIAFVVWCNTYIILGAYAMIQDVSLKNQPCGQQTHVWKYSMFNTVFCFFTIGSFLMFPGGGEGARARAMVITIFHGGFAAWAFLMFMEISDECDAVLSGQYEALNAYLHISLYHNLFFFALMLFHEVYLGPKLKSDFTLLADIQPGAPQLAYQQGAQLSPSGQAGSGGMMAGVPQPGASTPPSDMPPLNSEIVKDYADIIKSPPGKLYQGQP